MLRNVQCGSTLREIITSHCKNPVAFNLKEEYSSLMNMLNIKENLKDIMFLILYFYTFMSNSNKACLYVLMHIIYTM